MNRHWPARYATPELARKGRQLACQKRAQAKREEAAAKEHAALLEAERLRDAAEHERELDAPKESD